MWGRGSGRGSDRFEGGGAERGIAGIDWWILREYCHVQIVGFDFTEIPRFEWNPWNQQVS